MPSALGQECQSGCSTVPHFLPQGLALLDLVWTLKIYQVTKGTQQGSSQPAHVLLP